MDIFSYTGYIIPVIIYTLSVFSTAISLEAIYRLFIRYRPLDLATQIRLEGLVNAHYNGLYREVSGRVKKNPALQLLNETAAHSERLAAGPLEAYGQDMAERLQRRLPSLNIIAISAPLFGLLGTVTGMVKSFRAMSSGEGGALFAGVDEALLTTALGLFVGIPSMIVYHYCSVRLNRYINEINHCIEVLKKDG